MQSEEDKILVTKPFLPPLEEFTSHLEEIWKSGILTHNGPFVKKFESDLKQKLKVKNLLAVTNGTIAIQMAIKALELKGEIITTPFSWIATISAIKWEGCTPVFADIDPETFNLDPNRIEECITPSTVAILPVHVFGNPCDVQAIERIAKKHNLKVIYDAAHALGTKVENNSVLEYGDISATSLHGTKLLNTAEGGACITNNTLYANRLEEIRFFGHNAEKEIISDGFNGKMTEIHAALGLSSLNYLDAILKNRKVKYFLYKDALKANKTYTFQKLNGDGCNYSYFPVVFQSEETLLLAQDKLNTQGIYPRRYFYPSLNTIMKVVKYQEMPISSCLSKRILCLPLYNDLEDEKIVQIAEILNNL